MRKMDTDAMRQAILDGWSNYVAPDGDPDMTEDVALMKRGARAGAELTVFALSELERAGSGGDGVRALRGIAHVIGSALYSATRNISPDSDAADEYGDPINPQHAAIHVLVDGISSVLHALYYGEGEEKADNVEKVATVVVPYKDVGDA